MGTRAVTAERMTEDELMAWVTDLARVRGWLVAHFRPARRKDGSWVTPILGSPGFPDLVLTRKGRVILAELKAERGRITAEQKAWLSEMVDWDFEDWSSDDWARGFPVGAIQRSSGGKVIGALVCLWRPSHRRIIEDLLA